MQAMAAPNTRIAIIRGMTGADYVRHISELPAQLIKADMNLVSAEIKRSGMGAAETANLKSKLNFATDICKRKEEAALTPLAEERMTDLGSGRPSGADAFRRLKRPPIPGPRD